MPVGALCQGPDCLLLMVRQPDCGLKPGSYASRVVEAYRKMGQPAPVWVWAMRQRGSLLVPFLPNTNGEHCRRTRLQSRGAGGLRTTRLRTEHSRDSAVVGVWWPSLWEGVGGCSDVEPARPAGLESVQSLPGTGVTPCPTTNSSATIAKNCSPRSYPSSTTKKAKFCARTAA